MFANAKLAIANNGYNGIISKEMLGYSSFQKVDFLQNSLQGKEDRIMKSRKATLIQLLKRNLATVLIMVLLPIIPIQIAKAESLSISIGAAIEGQKISFSWNSITNAVRYEYSVRDLTTDEVIIFHEETTKTSGSIPASYVIKDHQYKVWVGAFYEVAEDNMPEATANSYITECAKKEKSTLYGTTYELYNDTYHKRYDVYDITCKVCGDHIEYRNETTKEKHTMKNGKCTVCGYEEEPEPLDVVVSRNQANAQVGDSIGATAEITGGSGSYLRDWTVTCDGETITTSSNNESEFNWIASKAGSWKFKITVLDNNTGEKVSDTSSAITVTEAECTHENTTETLIDTEYIQKNENHHTVRNIYRITCSNPSCGAILNPSYYKDTDEAHTFGTDRNCEKCGYVPPTEECNHENITSELLRTELRQCDSDNNHYSVAIYKDVCSDCGVTIKEEREVITLVLHEFVNGVCACGFSEPTPECDHATTRDKISTVLEQYSDTAHRMVITYHVYCECGQVDYEEEIKSFPEHQFDSNGLCECGYQKVEETSVSFSADKTEVTVGENVTFTITTNATSVDFVADGTAYNTVEVTGGRATYVRAFTEQGDRQIKFVAPDGTSSDTKTIRVTAKGQLDQTTISVPSSVEEGNSVTASWTAVDHAENYVARLYDDVPTELWKQETTGTSVTIPANLLEADKHYTVSVIATGTDYTQSESSAGFVVNAKQEEIVINGAFGQDSYTITAGETLDVAVSASVQNANLTRVTINVDGSDNNRLSSKEISGTSWNGALTLDGTAAPLNVPGTYTIKLFVGVDAGDPNWAEVDQATLTVTAPEEDNPKLPDPVIISPTAGDVLENTTFTLSWNAVNGADHYVYTASDLSQDAVKVIPVTATNGLSVELTLPEKGHNYRAAVGAVPAGVNDNESDKISWSTVEFSVQAEPKQLAYPTITYPSNGAVLDSTSVTVSWNDVDGAVDFAISVYDITSDKYIADRELTDYAFNAVINDLEWFHQYRVAVGAVPRKANGDSTKYSWSTVKFSVARAFIGTPTLEATGYYSVNGDPTYRVTAVTDGHITRLSGVNDTGTPLNETWDKTSNADGTITWVRVYTPGMSANNRTWTLTAWVRDQQIEQATTNAASMHVHTYGAKKYKDAHPHQYYQVCTACGHELLLYNQYYTANGTVQGLAVCCVCHGHQYGDAYEENGKWCQKCNYCNRIIGVEVNVNKKTNEEQSLVTKEQELNESLMKEQTIDDRTGKTPVDNTLAELSVDLANLAYGLGGRVTAIDGKHTVANTEAIKYLEGLGFGDVKSYNAISGDHTVGYYIAYKLIEDENGGIIPAFSVVIRGSIGDDKLRAPEWRSNFTVGGGDVHYGFKVAEMDLLENLNQYINNHLENGDKWQNGNYKLWITGHSRGAAVGNLLAADYLSFMDEDNVRAYLFATPKTTKNPIASSSIKNFIMDGDPVPRLPLSGWDYDWNGEVIYLENGSLFTRNEMDTIEKALYKIIPDSSAIGEVMTIVDKWDESSNMYEFIKNNKGYLIDLSSRINWDKCPEAINEITTVFSNHEGIADLNEAIGSTWNDLQNMSQDTHGLIDYTDASIDRLAESAQDIKALADLIMYLLSNSFTEHEQSLYGTIIHNMY